MGILVTERGINYHFYHIIKSKGNKLTEDYIKRRNDEIIFISKKGCSWDYNCYCLMDYFASMYKEAFDKYWLDHGGPVTSFFDDRLNLFLFMQNGDYITELQRDFENPGHLKSIRMDKLRLAYCPSFKKSIREMLKHPSLKHLDSKLLKQTIEKAASFMVKIRFEYISKRINKKGDLIFDFSKSFNGVNSDFTNVFNYKSKIIKVGKNNKIYNTEYEFTFDTILGALFIHNLSCQTFTYLDESFYSISKYAHLLYRKRYLSWKTMTTTLRMDTVLSDLCLQNKNYYEARKKFISIVEELVDNNLINIQKMSPEGKVIKYRTSKVEKSEDQGKVIDFEEKKKLSNLN